MTIELAKSCVRLCDGGGESGEDLPRCSGVGCGTLVYQGPGIVLPLPEVKPAIFRSMTEFPNIRFAVFEEITKHPVASAHFRFPPPVRECKEKRPIFPDHDRVAKETDVPVQCHACRATWLLKRAVVRRLKIEEVVADTDACAASQPVPQLIVCTDDDHRRKRNETRRFVRRQALLVLVEDEKAFRMRNEENIGLRALKGGRADRGEV
jgi:hypothetical protein